MRNLISIQDLTVSEILAIIKRAAELRQSPYKPYLKNKTVALFFQKPSTRTRASFEVAVSHMGGESMFLGPSDLQLSRGESLADTARTLSCYVDALVARVYGHGDIGELAMNSSIPVINGLSDAMHPCQALSDVITMHDKLGMLRGMKLAYFGNARNNVLHSLLHTGSKLGINIDVACPQKYEPDKAILDQCHANSEASGARIEVGQDPVKAARNADILYTDVWFSMHEKPSEAGRKALMPYQVTPMLMEKARRGAIFMHCLPAHRGEEVDARVIDGERSVVWDQAKSKLWTHKAILSLLVD